MLKKFAATTSTAALAIGMLAAGVGVATAQEEGGEEPNGTLSSDSLGLDLDLEKTAADLALAAEALNGPVDVTPGEDGTVVSYTNEGDATQKCGGMVFPYKSIAEEDVDMDNPLTILGPIETGGEVTIISADEDGNATATPLESDLVSALLPFIGFGEPTGVDVEGGETAEWTVTNENGPFAAAVICGSLDAVNFGIDKQVVADQINGKIPGGSIDPVGPGSISGGSVAIGATALGSLAGGDEEQEEPAE